MSRNPKPSIDCPKEIVDEPDNVQGILENDFRDSYFRVCRKCSKTRILDIRAANKFPLGSYYYAEQMRKIVFECSRLVSTDCSVPEDVQRRRPHRDRQQYRPTQKLRLWPRESPLVGPRFYQGSNAILAYARCHCPYQEEGGVSPTGSDTR